MKWDAEQAQRMRDAGVALKIIAKRYGIDPGTVKTRLDPEYAAFRRQSVNAARRARRGYGYVELHIVRSVPDFDPPPVPADLRTVTGILMGDPLPTRSALDRRQAAAGE